MPVPPPRPRPAGLVGAAAAGYLLGTLPSADVAARVASGGSADLRAAGTGNPGGANALVVLGRAWGYGIMLADIAKGAAACGAGRRLAADAGAHVAGVAAVVGHCFPVWNGFRGGKGVAASVGQCVATFPVYVPFDIGLAWLTATPRWSRKVGTRTLIATAVASSTWVAAATLWWRRGWPNGWAPRPTAGLPLAAAASSAVILSRFAAAARKANLAEKEGVA
ncbi:MAG: glycerol-3-phosphate acyltransferase [Actinomycetota bacterium]